MFVKPIPMFSPEMMKNKFLYPISDGNFTSIVNSEIRMNGVHIDVDKVIFTVKFISDKQRSNTNSPYNNIKGSFEDKLYTGRYRAPTSMSLSTLKNEIYNFEELGQLQNGYTIKNNSTRMIEKDSNMPLSFFMKNNDVIELSMPATQKRTRSD